MSCLIFEFIIQPENLQSKSLVHIVPLSPFKGCYITFVEFFGLFFNDFLLAWYCPFVSQLDIIFDRSLYFQILTYEMFLLKEWNAGILVLQSTTLPLSQYPLFRCPQSNLESRFIKTNPSIQYLRGNSLHGFLRLLWSWHQHLRLFTKLFNDQWKI